jgi:hypothetical protein
MHYLRTDIERLHLSVPHLKLATQRSALRFFEEVTQTGGELAHVLCRYPEVRYEPLDFHYVCMQSLGALNERVLSDLLTEQGWRGVLWGALLVALSPDARYRSLLESASGVAPYQQWAIDIALADLSGEQYAENRALQQTISTLSAQLAGHVRPAVALQEALPVEVLELRQQKVRAAYRQAGLAAAQAVLATVDNLNSGIQ